MLESLTAWHRGRYKGRTFASLAGGQALSRGFKVGALHADPSFSTNIPSGALGGVVGVGEPGHPLHIMERLGEPGFHGRGAADRLVVAAPVVVDVEVNRGDVLLDLLGVGVGPAREPRHRRPDGEVLGLHEAVGRIPELEVHVLTER